MHRRLCAARELLPGLISGLEGCILARPRQVQFAKHTPHSLTLLSGGPGLAVCFRIPDSMQWLLQTGSLEAS